MQVTIPISKALKEIVLPKIQENKSAGIRWHYPNHPCNNIKPAINNNNDIVWLKNNGYEVSINVDHKIQYDPNVHQPNDMSLEISWE